MRITRTLSALALIGLFALSASAQSFRAGQVPLGFTNVVASTASNSTAVIHCERAQNVAVSVSFAMTAADTSNQTFVFARSYDGITADTPATSIFSWAVAANGTTKVVASTNLPAYGLGGFRLLYVTNAAASAGMTNLLMYQTFKIGAP